MYLLPNSFITVTIKLYTHNIIIIYYILKTVCTESVDYMGHAVYVYYIYLSFIYI